jgi:catechol 2,3-dioxygenase-like lactoylglutathione lyase family enzyme
VKLQQIDHVAITVNDIEAAIAWYEQVLGLEEREMGWDGPPRMLFAGETCLALFPAAPGGATPLSEEEKRARATMRHVAFRVDRRNFERAQSEFREQGIEFEFADHGPAHSVYIADPDGHTIEITTYEVDYALPRLSRSVPRGALRNAEEVLRDLDGVEVAAGVKGRHGKQSGREQKKKNFGPY